MHVWYMARKVLEGTGVHESSSSFPKMSWAVVVSLHTTIVHALHSFIVLEARSPCCVIASHGYIVFCGLIALHGFAGWLRSSASQVAPFCLCPWSDCYISSTYSTFIFSTPLRLIGGPVWRLLLAQDSPIPLLVSMLLRYIACIIGYWQGTCYARTRGLETQVLWECIRGFVRLSLNINNTRFAPYLPCTTRSNNNAQFPLREALHVYNNAQSSEMRRRLRG
jgi:hypothetical protein